MAIARNQAKQAVESLGMTPVMFETMPPGVEDSRRELLDRLADCDVVVLLLGAEYGQSGTRGMSPTEEEFEHASTNGVPVLTLVQDGVERDEAQANFLARVRGTWEQGSFTGRFIDPGAVGLDVVKALNTWKERQLGTGGPDAAIEQALSLATRNERHGYNTYDARLRVVVVPTRSRPLLDAIALSDTQLPDDIAMSMRVSGLVGNETGLTAVVADRHILIRPGQDDAVPQSVVAPNGAIVAEVSVASESTFGSAAVEGPRVRFALAAAAKFARLTWDRIDTRDEVRDCLAMSAIPDPSQKVFSDATVTGSRFTVGSARTPPVLLAPQHPLPFRRTDLENAQTLDRLYAEVRQAFADLGALHSG